MSAQIEKQKSFIESFLGSDRNSRSMTTHRCQNALLPLTELLTKTFKRATILDMQRVTHFLAYTPLQNWRRAEHGLSATRGRPKKCEISSART